MSLKHEGVLELVRHRPAFAAELLGKLLAVKVPRFSKASCVDVTLNQAMPAEYRADAVVLFTKRKAVFGAIIEAQLEPEEDKRFTWPLYAVGARARERCPFVVLVLAPNAATARWAAQPIELGGGNQYTPLVIGPEGVPKLTDRARARREPQLAVLSVMAHGRGEVTTAVAIAVAAAAAVKQLPDEQRMLYSMLIEANLSEAARKAFEMQPGVAIFFNKAQRQNYERGEAKGRAEGEAKGEARGKAAALLTILTQRRLTSTAAQRRRIMGCADMAMLERWLDRALSVGSVTELLLAPKARRAKSNAGRANGRHKSR